MDPILFADTTTIIIDRLSNTLGGEGFADDVYSSIPNPRPAEFVVVERLGGPRQNIVADNAHIAVDCWAATDREAHDLAQMCRAFIHAMQGLAFEGGTVGRIDELSGPYRNPDPDSGQDRYSFQVTVAVRGQTLATGS
jgi:acetylornithine deacetylase/succinyl-diaminopimelate desuccinylase-like protein